MLTGKDEKLVSAFYAKERARRIHALRLREEISRIQKQHPNWPLKYVRSVAEAALKAEQN